MNVTFTKDKSHREGGMFLISLCIKHREEKRDVALKKKPKHLYSLLLLHTHMKTTTATTTTEGKKAYTNSQILQW